MSINVDILKKQEEKIKKSIAEFQKKAKAAESKLDDLHSKWPFKCSKCKTAYELKDLAYKIWHRIWNYMDCQYGGEYDIRQIEDKRYVACCPNCGHSFKVEVKDLFILHAHVRRAHRIHEIHGLVCQREDDLRQEKQSQKDDCLRYGD